MYCILYFGELEESTNYMQVFQDFSWEYFTWKLIVLLGLYHWFIQLTWSLPIYHGFAYRRETILFTWIKWALFKGYFETSPIASGTHKQLCSPAVFWAGMRFVLQENSRSCWQNAMIRKEAKQICFWGLSSSSSLYKPGNCLRSSAEMAQFLHRYYVWSSSQTAVLSSYLVSEESAQ